MGIHCLMEYKTAPCHVQLLYYDKCHHVCSFGRFSLDQPKHDIFSPKYIQLTCWCPQQSCKQSTYNWKPDWHLIDFKAKTKNSFSNKTLGWSCKAIRKMTQKWEDIIFNIIDIIINHYNAPQIILGDNGKNSSSLAEW
jgi:hypothetical protein